MWYFCEIYSKTEENGKVSSTNDVTVKIDFFNTPLCHVFSLGTYQKFNSASRFFYPEIFLKFQANFDGKLTKSIPIFPLIRTIIQKNYESLYGVNNLIVFSTDQRVKTA
jgi:hypothetical protein